MKKFVKNTLIFIILFFSFFLIFTVNWIYSTFGNISLEEIMFQINVPNTDVNIDYYYSYIQNALIYIIISTTILFILINKLLKKRNKHYPKRMIGKKYNTDTKSLVIYKEKEGYHKKIIVSLVILVISNLYFTYKTDFINFLEYQLSKSIFIEDEYVDASKVKIEFPEEKRNLIYIYLESMEATFFSKENGGAYNKSLIEELEELSNDNISFSTSKNAKGLYSMPGSTWTTGAMTAQTFGIPLKIPIEGNSYGKYNTYLPGATRVR